MARALFVCLHNAGRSQIGAALFERAAAGRHEARSAGTTPAERVQPEVVEAMSELGIDLSDRRPRMLTRADAEWADIVVTMGCGDECPYIPGKRYRDWELPDPKGLPLAAVRETREEIASRVAALVAELDAAAAAEAKVRGMVAELRAKPTAEKEDELGLAIATMPPAERDQVPAVLLRIVAEERRGRE